jgi:hypothetical protein
VKITNKKKAKSYQDQITLKASTNNHKYSGFALIVGEAASYQNYRNFKKVIKEDFSLDLSKIDRGQVSIKKNNNNLLTLTYNQDNLLPLLSQNNIPHKWSENFAIYNSLTDNQSPIYLGWKEGNLKIKLPNLNFETNFMFN